VSAGEAGGRDGAAVQADLRSVIDRARDARAVLGLGPNARPAEARAAFHALCKKYHPARFARSSPETVRLANEAFLAIKRAYDGLIAPESSAPAKEISKPLEPASAPSRAAPPIAAGTVPIAARVTEKIAPQPRPAPRPATGAIPAQGPRAPTDKQRAVTAAIPSAARPGTEKLPAQKKDEPAPATEEQRFALALDLLRRRLWRDAEKALGELAVSVPSEKKYRAYRHYAKGRLAQDDGRLDEARGEWERALRLEPDLAAARAAIESLPEPPKPSGGLLSKLFKR
jgi:tetratricopeptide (TPR) repeat protein